MAFVFYDCETSGLNTRFDQILHFAAVRTDETLEEVEIFEVRCRLDRHVLPHPQALALTNRTLSDAYDPSLPSHYEMMREVAALIERWSPAVFIGYNSIGFDEEMLRHSLYRTLHDPYLTTKNGNARGDALGLTRSAAFFRPGLLSIPIDGEGKETFRLPALAEANGHGGFEAHSALEDARATLAIARTVRSRDEEFWSRFLRFTNGQTAAAALDEGYPMGLVTFRGNTARCVVGLSLGHGRDRNARYCLDLNRVDELLAIDDHQLAPRLADRDGPIIRMKVKGSPCMCELWDLPEEIMMDRTEEDYEAIAQRVRSDPRLGGRILRTLIASERDWPVNEHVEERLYGGGFLTDEDLVHRDAFHRELWEAKSALLARMGDERMRKLGERLVFLEAPDTLDPAKRDRMEKAIGDRLRMPEDQVPWCTLARAERVIAEEMPLRADLAREYAALSNPTLA